MKKNIKIILALFFIVLVADLVWNFPKIHNANLEDLGIAHSLSSEYTNLFPVKNRNKLEMLDSYLSTNRDPFSFLLFDNKYSIVIYKISSSEERPLSEIINEKKGDVGEIQEVYHEVTENLFKLSYVSGHEHLDSNLTVIYSDDTLNVLRKNDSTVCYFTKFNSFSINYNNSIPDIIIQKAVNIFLGAGKENVPANIMFLKKNKSIYFLMMCPNKPDITIKRDLLFETITDSI